MTWGYVRLAAGAVFASCTVWTAGALAASDADDLPTITVVSKKKKPAQAHQVRRPVQAAPAAAAQPSTGVASSSAAVADGSGAAEVGSGGKPPSGMASEMHVSGEKLNQRPATRPGEVLEAVPGLIVTQHSGEGKANQYFLRGYNLDHGTDMAIYVDDVPVNMRTHGHGQGYSDLNWLMPETINSLDIRKGPYFADEGDFASVGNLHIGLVDRTERSTASVTVGSFGYRRLFGMGSSKVGDGTLLVAGEGGTYNGPWDNPDDVRKLNTLVRYTQGTATDGFSVTGMAYANKWNSTDQVPARAFDTGVLSRWGAIDPTDGGNTNRFALSSRIAGTDELGAWKANAYLVKSSLDLYNDFTYYLSDPVLGDQFHQHDGRLVLGGAASRSFLGSIGGLPTETVVGVQARYDDIDVTLTNTYRRSFVSNVRSDKVGESSVSIYAENTVHWASWLRTTLGWRGDYYDASVNSLFNANNSGRANEAIGSPKFRAVFGPFHQTEFFVGLGMGMHSNDARGATTTESPTDPSTRLDPSPFLVRTKGAEVGVRTKIVPGLTSTVSLFMLDQASEILFSGDAGDTAASRASRRYGVEFTNDYRPFSWLAFDADLAVTHARFVGYDGDQAALYASLAGYPEAQLGNAPGNFIPNAPAVVASVGVDLGEKTGWFGGLRWRYLGSVPLTEDDAWRSLPVSIVNGRIGYRTAEGWRIQLDALNLFNAKTNQISYGYGSLLKTDALYALCQSGSPPPAAVCQNGVMDAVVHPVEPLAVRLTIAGSF
ncbi:TonB-dependent receptor [Bradyrhizobium sp. INPA01-394B]|uniref:TonB-dependent receptor n=1 Tax=Bradyrhizobium campsiandrae TaxID=1729892 RepID=A0ABR7UB80_9BRAD|nr:TonB-dependent receptor [Bradyrhizobium campsiandrae]MBC9879619.1 TonB-dependent receptor [Bradyrhizobium campsiandrae]MBC9980776.1 TonB-dependent receptor [Bradyrhizobium campsiandrae]